MAADLTPRNKAASAARSTTAPVTAMMTSTMSVENIHAGITLHSFRPGSDLKSVEGGQRLFDRVLRSRFGRPFVLGYQPEDLFERRAMMAVARRGRRVIGVAHYHVVDKGMIVRGLAVHPAYAGNRLGAGLVAMALVHGRAVFGEIATVACVIRQMPDGSLNETSRKSFEKVGFALEPDIGTSFLTGSYRDRHLADTSERDAMGAIYVRHRRMSAGPESYGLARDFLADWACSILPIKQKRLAR